MASEPRLAVIAKLRAQSGRGNDLVAAVLPLFEGLPRLPGTPVFCLQTVKDDPDTLIFYELHTSAAAFRAADDAAALVLGASLDGLLAAPPEITMCQPVRTYGVRQPQSRTDRPS
jgi:quinol monooxygenase YgiN